MGTFDSEVACAAGDGGTWELIGVVAGAAAVLAVVIAAEAPPRLARLGEANRAGRALPWRLAGAPTSSARTCGDASAVVSWPRKSSATCAASASTEMLSIGRSSASPRGIT